MRQSKSVFTTLFTIAMLVCSVVQAQPSTISVDALSAPQDIQKGPLTAFSGPVNLDIQTPAKPVFLPQACEKSGNSEYGSVLCKQSLANGNKIQTESHVESIFNEIKIQTRFTALDAAGRLIDKKIIRRKTSFKSTADQTLSKESFDIVSYPPGQKILREVLIFEYAEDGKKLKKVSYAKYEQMGETDFASLLYHVALHYDTDGLPLKGRAERWKDGAKTTDFFKWDRVLDGVKGFDGQAWKQWEDLTQGAALREIFPL